MKAKLFIIAFVLFLGISISAQTLNVQGVLRDAENRAVADGDYTMVLNLYDAETATTPVFTESHTAAIVNGVYSIDLGSQKSTEFRALDFSKPYWLGIEVDGSEVSARSRLSMSPYLFSPVGGENMYPSAGEVILGGALNLKNQWATIPNVWAMRDAAGNYTLEHATSTSLGTFTYISAGKTSGNDFSSLVSENGFYLTKESGGSLLGMQMMHVNPAGKLSLRYGFGHEPRGVFDAYIRGVGYGVRLADEFEISSSDYNWPGVVFGFNAILSKESNSGFWMKANNPNKSGAFMYNTGGEIFFKGIDYSSTTDPSGDKHFVDDFRYNLTIRSDGRVGIGTDEPQGNLDVRGTVRVIKENGYWSINDATTLEAGLQFASDGFVVANANSGSTFTVIFFIRRSDGSWDKLGALESTYGQQTMTIPVIAGQTYAFELINAPTELRVFYFQMGR